MKVKFRKKIPETTLRRELIRLPWLLLIPLGLLLPKLAANHPDWIERWFSNGLYPVVHGVLGFISSAVPFSIAEFILYALIIGIPLLLIIQVYQTVKKRRAPVQLLRTVISLCIIAGVLINAMYLCWGLNYARPQLKTLLGLDVHERPAGQLIELSHTLADKANELRVHLREDEAGVFIYRTGLNDMLKSIPSAYTALAAKEGLFQNVRIYAPKYVLASEALSWAGISGIFIPFTAESNVNVHEPPLLTPTCAAHECAHAAGIARENEANFVGYLACMASGDMDLQYSAVMLALINCGNQVHALDKEAYRELYARYSDGVKRDLIAYSAYWDAYEGPVQEAMTEMNDGYLKHNQQESGVKSYGEMVDLLLAWYFKG